MLGNESEYMLALQNGIKERKIACIHCVYTRRGNGEEKLGKKTGLKK